MSGERPPRVAVTVTCYRLGRYLEEALDSVFAQTMQDFEVLIDDDGSDDDETRRVLDRLDRPRTRVFRRPHRGVVGARNALLAEARGEVLCALDADDRLHPTYFAKALAALDAEPEVGLVSCWVRSFGDEEGLWRPTRADLPALLAECTLLGPSLVRRAAVVAAGGYDPAFDRGDEDWDLFLRLLEAGHRAVILPEVLFDHRRRRGSLTDLCTRGELHLELHRALLARHAGGYRRHFPGVLAWKEDDAAGLERENARLEARLVALREERERRREELAPLRARAFGAGSDAVAAASGLAELEADRRWARRHIEEIHRSWSWRLTAPLRFAYDLVRAFARRPRR